MFHKSLYLCNILLSVCIIVQVTGKIQPLSIAENIIQSYITKCVLTISEKEFPVTDIITITSVNRQQTDITIFSDNILRIICKTHKWLVLSRKIDEKAVHLDNTWIKTDNYIIHLQRVDDLKETLTSLNRSLDWNPSARFIVISFNVFDSPLTNASNIVQIMWSFRILNAMLMIPTSKSTDDGLDLYIWYPYANGNCADTFTDIQVINQCKDGTLTNPEVSLFPNKIPNNLNGCYVRARPVPAAPYVILAKNLDRNKTNLNLSEGLEIMLLNTVAEAANFMLNYTISYNIFDWGDIIENKSTVTVTGLYESLLHGQVDIILGILGATEIRYKYMDYTVSYMYESLGWCVPQALPVPKWKCMFSPFRLTTWALTFVTLLLTALCQWTLSYNKSLEYSSYRNIQNCTSNTFAVLLGISVSKQPKTGFNRIFFLIWVIFALHLTIAYQTSLVSVLTSPMYEKQISTFDEIIENNLRIGGRYSLLRFFENQNDVRMKQVVSNFIFCDDGPSCLGIVAHKRDFAYAFIRRSFEYVEINFRDTDGNTLIYIFKENIVIFPLNMYLSKNFPLTDRINSLILRIIQAGLMELWFKQFSLKPTININTLSETEQKLSLHNIQAAFFILGFGLIIASIVSVLEIISQKCHIKILKSNHYGTDLI